MVFLMLVYAIIFATYDPGYVYKIEKVYLEIYRKGFPDGRYASRVLHRRCSTRPSPPLENAAYLRETAFIFHLFI